MVIVIAGLCVNPVQQGVSILTKSDFVKGVGAVVEQDSTAHWIADNSAFSQAAIVGGARAINSVALYPNLNTWHALDEDGVYESIYNRYAHISFAPTNAETTFENPGLDSIIVHINPDDLAKIDADYWASALDLTEYNTEHTVFNPIAQAGPCIIYRIEST